LWINGTLNKISILISISNHIKSAGVDEIVAALLQKGNEKLAAHLYCIFRAYLARGNIQKGWR